MEKKLAEARKRMMAGANGVGEGVEDLTTGLEAKDLNVYRYLLNSLFLYYQYHLRIIRSVGEYPNDTNQFRLKVDLEKECLLVPINGHTVPFHISTIKSMTQPDPDMRINFYIPGSASGKEVAKNMQYLLLKYGEKAAFIKVLFSIILINFI
jgi:hypothetical protein